MIGSFEHISEADIEDTASYIRNRIKEVEIPKIAISCGPGLNKLGDDIKNKVIIPYGEIPNFPKASVSWHKNRMIIGILSKTPVIILQGRFHFYEGLTVEQCTFYVKILGVLGVQFLVLSNAAGGINPDLKPGDILLIKDHIYMGSFSSSPLIAQDDAKGFTEKANKPIYDRNIIRKCEDLLKAIGYEGNIRSGVYAFLSGSNYDTVAEIKLLETFGADVVGTATIPDVVEAHELGMQAVAFCLISNMYNENYEEATEAHHQEVIKVCSNRSVSLKMFAERLIDFLGTYL